MRFLPVSLTVLLVELQDLDETLALFSSLQSTPVAGLEDLIPAARTLMIRFRPETISAEALCAEILGRDLSAPLVSAQTLVEIPVTYDGEDLDDVARLTGLSVADVIRRHTDSLFTVAFCGFAPGFGYLVGGDPALQVPRRQAPRTRIPAGSVALAGAFSGVYPQASPGGWQIIGTTPLKMWDLSRDPPALFQPGGQVRFVDLAKSRGATIRAVEPSKGVPATVDEGRPHLCVRHAPIPVLVQDLGRFGQTGQGVSASGALDQRSFRQANRIVGNGVSAPALEITQGGLVLESRARSVISLTGAECPVRITDAAGRTYPAAFNQPLAIEEGDIITLGAPVRGMRSYLAVRGGFDIAPVLGSCSTDTLAVVGPPPVVAGTLLPIAMVGQGLNCVVADDAPPWPMPASGETVTLDIVLGPRTDWFTDRGLDTLVSQIWEVTPQSNRVGMRLSGDVGIERRDQAELPSEGTATGAIQIPHNGQPVLFLADHPLTGGYPVIGAVAEHHLDLAGQIPIHSKIRFRPLAEFRDLTATMTDRRRVQPAGDRA